MLQEQNIIFGFENIETGMTAETYEMMKQRVREIVNAPDTLIDHKRDMLVDTAFKTLSYPPISKEARQLIENGTICLLGEGPAPYHPRYVAPDFKRLLEQGTEFFELKPAQTMYDVVELLLTAYQYAPSATLPVYLGQLDELFEPYLDTVSEGEARNLMRTFWRLVDRLHPNGFVHANIGPEETRAGNLLLEIDREVNSITNLTLKYDPTLTSRDFALKAVKNSLQLSKPYFINHPEMVKDWGENYVLASCFNPMLLGGGIFTLVRLNFNRLLSHLDCSLETVLNEVLPETAKLHMEIINSRIRYLVEEVKWFEHSVFVREGLLHPERFTTYAAVFGLNEGINALMNKWGKPEAKYGHNPEANQTASAITSRYLDLLNEVPAEHCLGTGNKISYHAQVGISNDLDTTPGVRIPAGEEPPLYEHFTAVAPQHKLFAGGISTIIEFDQTARANPEGVLQIIEGAHKLGLRNLSVGSCDSEYIRVSGYLIRRSDLDAARTEKIERVESNGFGKTFFDSQPNSLHRRIRKV